MFRSFILFFCCMALTANLFGQKFSVLIGQGKESLQEGDYYSASAYFKKALAIDSTLAELQYLCAEASRLNFDLITAEHWYTKVTKSDQAKSYPEAVFWLAMVKKSRGKYKDAQKLFDKYAKKFKKKNTYFTQKARQEVSACSEAQLLLKSPANFIVIHLDTAVNSKVSEYAPYERDSVLYFSSLRLSNQQGDKQGMNKIYVSARDSIRYDQAFPFDTLFNEPGTHNANISFTADGKQVFFSRCKRINTSSFDCAIYTSVLSGNEWSEPVLLPDVVNYPGANTTHPFVANLPDQTLLFFSSNRPGGLGGMDIWFSEMQPNNTFRTAMNAGSKVNSLDDEITPFYCSPCNELFFSSNWHAGLGGFDIFQSKFIDTAFALPVNMGFPLNSSYNDLYFSISNDNSRAYFSSNRPGSYFEKNETCCNDIYVVDLPKRPVEKKEEPPVDSTLLRINQMKLLVPITLYFHNDEPDNKTLATVTKQNYLQSFTNYLKLRTKYDEEYSKGLRNEKKEQAISQIEAFFEDSVVSGFEDLEKFTAMLQQLLEKGEEVIIIMKGFCSPLASTDYNINLAKRRISSLRNYFAEYHNGVLLPYINGAASAGKLVLEEEDVGELKARPEVSDDYFDVKNSIYSPLAAAERKIQIIAFSVKAK